MMINIYTDGSSIGNPWPWGRGAIIVQEKKETILSGGEQDTTNNRMELLAVIKALKYFLGDISEVGSQNSEVDWWWIGLFSQNVKDLEKIDHSITVHTDSQYVQKWVEERLATRVRRNRRLSKWGKTIKNVDLRQQMHALLGYFPKLQWQRVKGHAGHVMNERVDDIARGEAEKRC